MNRPLVERGGEREKRKGPPLPSPLSLLFPCYFSPNREPVHRLVCFATMPMLADTHISSLGYLWRDTDKSRYFAITAEFHNSCIMQTPSLCFDKYYRRRNLARKTIFRVTSNGLRYEENHPSWRDTFTIHLLCSLPFKSADCGVAGRTHSVPSVVSFIQRCV